MSLLRTPPKGVSVKTRSQTRAMEQLTTKSEQLVITKSVKSDKTACSSAAARKRLEYEAAQKQARIDLELAEKSAQIEKDLLLKKLEVDIADLEEENRGSVSKSSQKIDAWFATQQDGVASITQSDCVENARDPVNPMPCEDSKDRQCDPCNKTSWHRTDRHQDLGDESSPHGNSVKQLTEALHQILMKSNERDKCDNSKELLARLATSKDLPVFDGDPMQWLQFKESYKESSHICRYSDAENIWRLRKCLRGDAKEAVSSLLIGNTTPQAIIDTLELRFGRPECIIHKIITQLKKIHPLPTAYHTEIVNFAIKVKNYVTAVKAIRMHEYLQSPETTSIILSKLPPALINKWAEYSYDRQDSSIPKLELLSEFLYREANIVASSGVSHIHSQNDVRKKYENTKTHSVLACTTTSDDKCLFCRASPTHALEKCGKFKRAMRRDRWQFVRAKHLCYKCLGPRHTESAACRAPDCSECGHPHHHLLHWTKPAAPAAPVESAPAADTVAHASAPISVSVSPVPKVLLKIVPVTVHGPKDNIHTHALLDDGATVTLIAADLADQAGLHGKSVTMRARGAWDSGEIVCQTETVSFDISNNKGDHYNLCARKMKELNLPIQRLSCLDLSKYSYFDDNNYDFCKCDAQPKLLIGQDNYNLIAPILCLKSNNRNEPYVTKTPLGWCVHGVVNNIINTSADCIASDDSAQHCCDSELHEYVRKSFAFESIGISKKPRQNADELRAITILNNTCELINNQWFVELPWKYDNFVVPDSYQNAFNRLKSVERKMLADSAYASRYQERMQHLFSNNYARRLDEGESSDHVWYLPHFGVDNPNKKKLRLVFDAAAKTQGYSLNDFLLTGPDLLQSLFGIMFRFRENQIGIIADIKDMFLRIKIKEKDQHALRFLFRDKTTKDVRKYAMTSLIFGANCSPFIAQHIKNKNALKFKDTYPRAVDAICKQHYMDDYIDSLPDIGLTKQIIEEVSYIHQQGGFEIRNWASNVPDVLDSLSKEALSDSACCAIDQDSNQSERTLGLLWYPASDELGFDLSLKRIPGDIVNLTRKPTKREMLRIIMSIFDIHGFLGPFTIRAKILMQKTWKTDLPWDQELPEDLFIIFVEWITQLKAIKHIRIPRYFFQDRDRDAPLCPSPANSAARASEATSLELHVFCDASPSAYAAVAYWRKKYNDKVIVSFVASKSRVAPTKLVTIPRLELQGALLACRLADTIKQEHRLIPTATFYWTDSTTVLHWIRNESRNYKVFIANRLGEIDELSKIQEWHYVPTDLNVADLASKSNDYELKSNCEWFMGPSFLHDDDTKSWPQEPENKIKITEEILEKINIINENNSVKYDLPAPEPTRFSSWLRLLRATATVLLFIDKCKKIKINGLTDELMKRAETLLLKRSQATTFLGDILLLKQNKGIKRDSRLRALTPILDDTGLLRVGGRIGAAQSVPTDTKSPVILDGHDHVARLIVKHYHIRAGHGCNELVVNELRQKYWLLRLRPTVRTIAAQCMFCRIRKANPKPPRLGDLPEARLTLHQRPFTVTGVDLFGPIEVTVARSRPKRYGVLFTCLTVRAVHIEIVSSLTADSLIMALRRMAARRGWPKKIYSDNGTNMRGAETELKKAFDGIDKDTVTNEALNHGVCWSFIPPASPHMGGSWERLVRSVKTALKVVLKERAPREETLATLLTEVENIINSRPLAHVSVDPRDDETLTPNHFLIGSSSNLPQAGLFDDKDLCLRKQWRISQRLADHFWARWIKEILPDLVPRRKWTEEGTQLKVGDTVIVVDPNFPRNCWLKGVIQTVYPGADGRVRVVDVKTSQGVILKRPATRIAVF